MVETPLEENEIQLTEEYRIGFDIRNIILRERYEKKESRGKNSAGSGIFDYKDVGYYGTLKSLGNALIHKEVIRSLNEIGNLYEVINHIDKVKEEVISSLNENIIINLGESDKKIGKKFIKGVEVE